MMYYPFTEFSIINMWKVLMGYHIEERKKCFSCSLYNKDFPKDLALVQKKKLLDYVCVSVFLII